MPQPSLDSEFTETNAHDGSAMPGSVADACARVWLAKCVIAIFDIIDVDGAERRLRLLQGRASLHLNKLILEITARKGGDDLVALLRRVLVISNPDDVDQNTRVCERDFGPHVLGDTWRGMQGNGFPNQIRFRLGDAMAAEKFARCVRAINFKPLCVGMIRVDKPQVVKQRRDIEQFRIEFEILADALHCAEHKTRTEWLYNISVSCCRTSSAAWRAILLSGILMPEKTSVIVELLSPCLRSCRTGAFILPVGSGPSLKPDQLKSRRRRRRGGIVEHRPLTSYSLREGGKGGRDRPPRP